MNKSLAFIVACMAFLTGFAADPLAGLTKFYWNKPDGGNWNTAANWVMADGSTATTYPQSATDAAIFNGVNVGKKVSIPNNVTVEPGAVYLEDGATGFYFGSGTHVNVTRFLREDHAVMVCSANGYNHAQPNDFVISNRTDVLRDDCIPGAQWIKQDGDYSQPRSVGIVDETFRVKSAVDTSLNMAVTVSKTQTWGSHYSYCYGNYGSGRHVSFSGDYTLTIPSGQIFPLSVSHFGTTSASQGTVASENSLLFWPYSPTNNFRSVVQAPKFVQASRYTTLYYDDHSSETCGYYIPQGTLVLGDSAATDLTATCKLGTGDVNVSWTGTLSVQCVGALEKVGAIRMTSYRGQGSKWGKIEMGVSDSVNSVTLDGQALPAGTYGATGSGAANIDDDHFVGTGVLTVLGGSPATSSGVVIIVE